MNFSFNLIVCCGEMESKTINTQACGPVNVFVQGNLASGNAVFFTCHDFGCNALSFAPLLLEPTMAEVLEKSVWVHFEVPGQGSGAESLPADKPFPTMDQLASAVNEAVTALGIKAVIFFGEGAGGNILTRATMQSSDRVLGLIAIHSTSTSAGVLETIKDKWMSWKMQQGGLDPTVEEYLVMYKYGRFIEDETEEKQAAQRQALVDRYLSELKGKINPVNLDRFMNSFLNRTDISSQLREKLDCDTLVVVGSKSSFLHTTLTLYQNLDPQRSSLLRIDDVGDVVNQAPADLARGLILFCKAFGVLTNVKVPKMAPGGNNVTLTM